MIASSKPSQATTTQCLPNQRTLARSDCFSQRNSLSNRAMVVEWIMPLFHAGRQDPQSDVDEHGASIKYLQGIIIMNLEHKIEPVKWNAQSEKSRTHAKPKGGDDDNDLDAEAIEKRNAEKHEVDRGIIPSQEVYEAEHDEDRGHIRIGALVPWSFPLGSSRFPECRELPGHNALPSGQIVTAGCAKNCPTRKRPTTRWATGGNGN